MFAPKNYDSYERSYRKSIKNNQSNTLAVDFLIVKIEDLIDFLNKNHQIDVLYLYTKKITYDDFSKLINNTQLKVIRYQQGEIITHDDILGKYEEEASGSVKRFTESLKKNKTIKSLDLSLTKCYQLDIIDSLKENDTLESLSISDVSLQGSKVISDFLAINKSLKSLKICYCESFPCVKNIMSSLANNTSLKSFYLQSKFIGLEVVSPMLDNNKTLESLSFYGSRISDSNLKLLQKTQNKSLQNLDLSNNEITSKGAKTLQSLQSKNPKLIVNLDRNNVTYDETRAIGLRLSPASEFSKQELINYILKISQSKIWNGDMPEGVQKIINIITDDTYNLDTKLNKIYELAHYKQSYYLGFLHEIARNRDPQTNQFYIILAKLDGLDSICIDHVQKELIQHFAAPISVMKYGF